MLKITAENTTQKTINVTANIFVKDLETAYHLMGWLTDGFNRVYVIDTETGEAVYSVYTAYEHFKQQRSEAEALSMATWSLEKLGE
jgi:hypothetical protein